MESVEWIDFFLDNLKNERRLSPHTLTAYKKDLFQFKDFVIRSFENMDMLSIASSDIRLWVIHLAESGLSARSINRKIASLRSFYAYLKRQRKISNNPVSHVKGLKTPESLPVFLTENSLTESFDRIPFPSDFEGVRDKTIILLFYGTGIRQSELINLTSEDVDLSGHKIKVLGKRSKYRIIPLTVELGEALNTYKLTKVKEGISTENFFCRKNGEPMYPVLVQRIVKKYLGMLTSMSKRSPHVLRHSYATHLLNAGADLNAIKDLLGHSSLAATQVYTHNSIAKLKEIHKKAHPKSKG